MYELLSRPALYRRCADDPGYCCKVVEEGLRFQSPATIPRLVNADLVYRDVLLPKDTLLFLPVGMATRDPSAVPNPDGFDRARTDRRRAASDRTAHHPSQTGGPARSPAFHGRLGPARPTDRIHACARTRPVTRLARPDDGVLDARGDALDLGQISL